MLLSAKFGFLISLPLGPLLVTAGLSAFSSGGLLSCWLMAPRFDRQRKQLEPVPRPMPLFQENFEVLVSSLWMIQGTPNSQEVVGAIVGGMGGLNSTIL